MGSREPAGKSCGQAYLLFGISLLLVATVGTVAQIFSVPAGLAFTELALILLPAVVFLAWKRLPVARALRWRRTSPLTSLLGIAVGTAGWGVAAGIHEFVSKPLLGEPPEMPMWSPQTLSHLLLLLFSGALLAGLCEETLFRGVLQSVFRRRGSRTAVVLTAWLFAVYHVNPWALVPAFFLGLVFGTLVERTGSSIPAILAHCANNATSFTVAYLYLGQPETAARLPMAWLAAGFAVVFPVFWIHTRAHQPEEPILATVPVGLSRTYLWLGGFAGGGVVLLIIALAAAAFALVEVHTVRSDALAPGIREGQQLILLESRGFLTLDLEVGDRVFCPVAGEDVLFTIVRIEEERVWLSDGASERSVDRRDIASKVVHVLDSSSR